ncbi:glycosyltransferase family 4 protein [Microbacterium trichothecenolyticum]|uniref:Glycosyltransferase involved in cell wall biosynthesis n=1 Tax=Microbacterium trichothecenolyticum TaxID=69370 RepID=A0ABU0TXU5_MICTR|nr:glycosyltransferase family 4 protein [Microbacterium trichothecenolyticum]MDQ1124483.1 glycosyltransferase involved in cell wall biosynthesis [Microbacterium trichothecenolyticum]
MDELSIVQPYVPRYRVPFFDGLADALHADGVRLRVIAGSPTGAQAERQDAASAPWLETVESRVLAVGRRHLSLTSSRKLWRGSDAVIVPYQGTSLDALSALLRRNDRKVGVWGHIASYTSPLNALDGAIERWQLRRADHVFAYMPSGAAFARRAGVTPDRITTTMNSIDSAELEREVAALTGTTARQKLRERGVPDGPYLAYVGGLDESKRISFLAHALDIVRERGSDVHVVVLGLGGQAGVLDRAASRGQVSMLGYGAAADKAAVLVGAEAVVNPGRVGLIAVDCLAARTPLITTDWPWHAPELEYLIEGEQVQITADDPLAFADAMIAASAGALEHPDTSWPPAPSIDGMVTNFRTGVRHMLAL